MRPGSSIAARNASKRDYVGPNVILRQITGGFGRELISSTVSHLATMAE
jgi:hypothetical protein